jgi:threonine dehydrogenase-like Zn-dependent dehydrogenase
VPPPELRGPEDAIVRIAAAGLCRTDLDIIDGFARDRAAAFASP